MDFEETMDNEELDLSEEVVEEPEEEAEELPAEDDVPEQPEEPKAKDEPGYVQKRIDKALARERDSMRAAIMAEIEAQYAPIKERLLEMDAQELVRTGQVKDIEIAKELIRLRNGQPVREENPQPREANGQFAPKEDPATMARIDMLKHQANRIKAQGGPDVIAEWNSNEEIKKAVINGEMDFYDVAEQMSKPRKRPPSPMRSPNGANAMNPNAITSMSDEMFDKMDKRISEGARYKLG
ncbi:MAG: hypothetical protein II544_06295 [Spirochaetales bacterium]|nr:hypothetical protein [Spirochaetales bacterium]